MPVTSEDIAQLYKHVKVEVATNPARRGDLLALLGQFLFENESPASSLNYQSNAPDPVLEFIDMLTLRPVQRDSVIVLALMKSMKILTRKQVNRCRVGNEGICALLLNLSPPLSTAIAAEGASVIMNLCYEPINVSFLLRTPGVQMLVGFISEEDAELQANAAGALQSVCFHDAGRRAVLELDGMQSLLVLLSSEDPKVVIRTTGAVHNLSSDPDAIQLIRQYGGIPQLITLLSSDLEAVPGSAAGVLQNISCELSSRLLIKALDALPPLARLLSSPDIQAQVCAAGAILNILGPEMDGTDNEASGHRRAMGKIMSMIMAASAVHHVLYHKAPELDGLG